MKQIGIVVKNYKTYLQFLSIKSYFKENQISFINVKKIKL